MKSRTSRSLCGFGRRSALGLVAVVIIASSIVSAPSVARAADQGAGRIVYEQDGSIRSVNADGTDERTLTKGDRDRGASWSPDGKQILFLHGNDELYVMNRDGSNPHLLRHLQGSIESARWSPDGKTLGLIYRESGQPGQGPGFFLLSVDGQVLPRLVRENTWGVNWSPDGKKVVLINSPSPGARTVVIANPDGSHDVPLITSDILHFTEEAAWSPDGRQVALVASTTSQAGIFVVNSDGSGARLLAADSREWQHCRHPSWSPDGGQIAFSCSAMPACSGGVPSGIPKKGSPPSLTTCVRPLFVVPLNDSLTRPTQITDHDALFPEFAPRQ
jgi:Tol biopolymer transport system component